MSLISWTDITTNPIHIVREDGANGGHFCRKVSPGCLHCYSETQNQSGYFSFASKLPYAGQAPENLMFDDAVMEKLLRMRSSKKVFLCSMTDLFGDWVPDEWIDKAFAYIVLSRQHTFQVLTKRPERMESYFHGNQKRIADAAIALAKKLGWVRSKYEFCEEFDSCSAFANIWLGCSVENQEMADRRIPYLWKTPAVIRFLSCEPLLESIDISDYLSGLDWVIIGGESGAKSRPCHSQWIESIVTQCQQAKVSVFVKQLGQNAFIDYGLPGLSYKAKLKDRKGAGMAEWPENIRVRQFPIIQDEFSKHGRANYNLSSANLNIPSKYHND
jgi:protein gp37